MQQTDIRRTGGPRALALRLDIALLDLFDAVYRLRNLTQAGARLGLTQPAVSRGLARLREAYGDALFVRQQRGVLPTPFADQLARPLAEALAIVRSTIERPRFDPGSDQRNFRIAMTDIGERFFLPRLIAHLARAAPRIGVESTMLALPELKASLESGDIDLVAGYLPELGKQVHHRRLFRERFVYVARAAHPRIGRGLSRDQLRDLPHVLAAPAGWPHAGAIDRVLGSSRVRAPIALRARSFLCVAPIIAQTDSVSIMPSNLAALFCEQFELRSIEPPVQFPAFDVSLAWHDRYHRDPAGEWLRAQFIDLFQPRHGAAGNAAA